MPCSVRCWTLKSINNVSGPSYGMEEVFSLCHLLSPCESLGVQAMIEKLVIEVRVNDLALEVRVEMHYINRSA